MYLCAGGSTGSPVKGASEREKKKIRAMVGGFVTHFLLLRFFLPEYVTTYEL